MLAVSKIKNIIFTIFLLFICSILLINLNACAKPISEKSISLNTAINISEDEKAVLYNKESMGSIYVSTIPPTKEMEDYVIENAPSQVEMWEEDSDSGVDIKNTEGVYLGTPFKIWSKTDYIEYHCPVICEGIILGVFIIGYDKGEHIMSLNSAYSTKIQDLLTLTSINTPAVMFTFGGTLFSKIRDDINVIYSPPRSPIHCAVENCPDITGAEAVNILEPTKRIVLE